VVMVYSASFVVGAERFGSPVFFLQRHCIYLLAGCLALALASLWDYHDLAKRWPWLLGAAAVLLLGVLVPGLGDRINGAQRWYRLGPLTFQPSELTKPLLILAVAGWAVSRREHIKSFTQGFLPAGLILAGFVGLIALQPDLGTAALTGAVLAALLFVAGVRLVHALPILLLAVPGAVFLAWTKLGYVRSRVESFMDGDLDPTGKGYQVYQGLIAQGSGGWWGMGLGQGPSKLLFLPEAHNDFILALIGQELGLIGTLCVVLAFALFVWQGWRVAAHAPDMLGTLIALGVTLVIGLQAAMNIAVVTHSMPTKGISLPLISYGGSALIFTLFSIGLLLNVAAHQPAREPETETGSQPNTDTNPMRQATILSDKPAEALPVV
jgi:cell division protein FtsW